MFGYISFKARILIGFSLILSLMIGLAGYSLVNYAETKRDLENIDSTYLPHALLAAQMGHDVVQVQQFLTDVSATHNPAGYEDAESAAQEFKKGLLTFQARTDTDPTQLHALKALETDFDTFYTDGKRMAAAYISNGIEAGNLIMEDFDQSSLNLTTRMNALRDSEAKAASEHVHSLSESAISGSRMMWVITLISIFLGLGIALYLTRYLSQQLGIDPFYAKAIANDVANGRLDSDIQVNPGDTSSLLYSLKIMQDAINAFVAAQNEMARQHADGWISAQMDANKFPGTYGKMAAEINELVNSHITVKMQVVKVISAYANGDFSVDMERLPGEKAKITTAIDHVKTTLLDISHEIKLLGEAGINGDFSYRSDAAKFQFMFKDILTDLNNLFETCDTAFNDVSRVTQALAKGNLTQIITRDYPGTFGEVKTSVNSTITNLTGMIQEIKQSTTTINTAAKEIASGNNDLSHRVEQQASSVEQTASSMEELTSTVKNNAGNAQQANQVATNAQHLAEKGGQVVTAAVHAMQEINASSTKIAAIIGVIDEIAFQTNLLALNASVEAARAGDHGRGFSVVATEVRNLAQRSATAARESKILIQTSIEKVRVGTEFVNDTGKSLTEIVQSVKQVGGIIAEIAAASSQQSAGIELVNHAVTQLDEITQQNAALAEQAAAASISMTDQTLLMNNLLAFFEVGNSATSIAHKPALKPSTPATIKPPHAAPAKKAEVMDLSMAMQKHSDWKVKLRTAIVNQEQMDAVTIAKDNCCDFGKWLHGSARSTLSHLDAYVACVSKHASFHIEAGKVASTINAKKFSEAEAMLNHDTPYAAASSAVGVAIMRLQKDLEGSSSAQSAAKPKPSLVSAGNDEWDEF
ncbi:MAG: methyl-accepting chemotaxis protein [Methylococcales bacterium]|nr:methyl-accepting chemotaxis protein [Methylococcales bacterium]